ncbi:MAG TPA: tRNA (adenosine(37)-N6)-dimethylallyltransferase MiaA [Gaiellaceae bacterium]|nr:tRNA (adenosine(37)-N6)-dimethylallyltransferase MiaA [Gaiellaceae bacterium]
MRILVTGSSGQIGTNLALRLIADGHEVFGVDKRQNPWTDAFPYLMQDLASPYPAFSGGIGGVEYPQVDAVVHLAAHAKVHQLVAEPHRALENVVMTFNVLEYARGLGLPLVYASTREVYGDIRRFEGYGEETADFAFTESPYSASKIAGEAFLYSYARCYGLDYLAFRFSNVYGRYDNDLHRMSRVIPLFVHRLSRGEPVTVYGGDDKTLDFTYVDDCVDGIGRGVAALVEGRVRNETINLVLRAREHPRPRRRADRGRARRRGGDRPRARATRRGDALRRRHPQGQGAPRLGARDAARAWHPEGGRLVQRVACRSSGAGARTDRGGVDRMEEARHRSRVLALFGPTASGKSAVAAEIGRRVPAEAISADAFQIYSGLPILTAQPEEPTRLVGIRSLDEEFSVGAYERLAHAAIDEALTAGRLPVVVGGTGLYLRAALADLRLPPAPPEGLRERLDADYTRLGPERAHALLAVRDPAAAAAVHPNDRRRVVRALELAELGASLAGTRLWSDDLRHPTLVVGLEVPRDELARRIDARTRQMFEHGVEDEVRRALAGELSATARKVLGLQEVAELAREQAIERIALRTRRYAAYQRKWMRRIPGLVPVDAAREPAEVAAEILRLME